MNIMFLDIDGVLQPGYSKHRFNVDKKIIEMLSDKYSIDYSQYDFYDVAAVYCDWDKQAVCRLKCTLDKTNSKIITSSDWRSSKYPNKMKDLLKIQGLDPYYYCDNVILPREGLYDTLYTIRAREINDSLNRYSIYNYVVLDDCEKMAEFFPNNSVITHNIISDDDMHKCISILKR